MRRIHITHIGLLLAAADSLGATVRIIEPDPPDRPTPDEIAAMLKPACAHQGPKPTDRRGWWAYNRDLQRNSYRPEPPGVTRRRRRGQPNF